MKTIETIPTEWDYTSLAEAYLRRPDYADDVIDALVLAAVGLGERACDVGAGVAHLTLGLAARGLSVDAVEPNGAMRARGIQRTRDLERVRWHAGVGEATGMPARAYALVTFGSSFNVCDRPKALAEAARLLVPGGTFACLWNHRDLSDPLQAAIEAAIHACVPGYDYGTRREDQTRVIQESGLFGPVEALTGRVLHRQDAADCVAAWRSHATLQRQAGERFDDVLEVIEALVLAAGPTVTVPYETHGWMARVRES